MACVLFVYSAWISVQCMWVCVRYTWLLYVILSFIHDTVSYVTNKHTALTLLKNSAHLLTSHSLLVFWLVYSCVFVVESHNREKRRCCTKKNNKSILNCTTKKNWLQKICIWKDIDFDNKVRKWTNGSENNEDGVKLRDNEWRGWVIWVPFHGVEGKFSMRRKIDFLQKTQITLSKNFLCCTV